MHFLCSVPDAPNSTPPEPAQQPPPQPPGSCAPHGPNQPHNAPSYRRYLRRHCPLLHRALPTTHRSSAAPGSICGPNYPCGSRPAMACPSGLPAQLRPRPARGARPTAPRATRHHTQRSSGHHQGAGAPAVHLRNQRSRKNWTLPCAAPQPAGTLPRQPTRAGPTHPTQPATPGSHSAPCISMHAIPHVASGCASDPPAPLLGLLAGPRPLRPSCPRAAPIASHPARGAAARRPMPPRYACRHLCPGHPANLSRVCNHLSCAPAVPYTPCSPCSQLAHPTCTPQTRLYHGRPSSRVQWAPSPATAPSALPTL